MTLTERPSTPDELLRDVAPNQPVLLVGPSEVWATSGIAAWIESAGWSSTCAEDLDRACWLATIQRFSLVLVSGAALDQVWNAVGALRPLTMAPLVVAATTPSSAVVSLVGAGVDAVVDPASGSDEVFARVVALMRRSDHGWAPGVRYLRAGALLVDLWAHECFLDDEALALSPTEYALLTFLMTHPQEALASDTIVRRVWGWYTADGRNALRIFVNRVRRKLGDDPRDPSFIASVRGTGYRFVRNVSQFGDDAELLADHTDIAGLLRSIEDLTVGLQRSRTVEQAAERLLETLDATGYADGMAVFRIDGAVQQMQLVTCRGMSTVWRTRVGSGIPLTTTFASAHSVIIGEPVQFGDIRQMARKFSATATELADTGYRACMFLPIGGNDGVWGHLGVARRTTAPFDTTGSAYLRAACAVFALRVEELMGT